MAQTSIQKQSVRKHTEEKVAGSQRAIGRAAGSLAVIAVVSKVFGFTEKLIVAHFFGTDAQADVYFAAMGIVLSIVFLVKELVYPSVLPVFAQALKTSFAASSALFKQVFLCLTGVLAVFVLMIILGSDKLTAILVPGFSEEKKILTASLLRYLAPGCLFLCLTTLTYAVLNCRRQFLRAALPEAAFKCLMAAGLILLAPLMGLYALAAALTVASLMVFIVQFFFIPEGRAVLTSNSLGSNHEFKKILILMGPLALGVVFSHISGLVDNMLASTLPTGQLSFLGYSKKLIDAILLVGPVALVTVVYSHLSHLNTEGRSQEFKSLFVKSLRLILFISIPMAILLILLREPAVTTLFERGRFDTGSTAGTSQALYIYALGLVTFSLEALFVYSFYALSNTQTPVRVGILGVVLDILLAFSLVGPFGFAGIAWALVISKTVKVIILLLVLNRKFRFLDDHAFLNFFLRITVSCLPSTACLYLLKGITIGSSFMQTCVFDLAVPAAGFMMVFLLSCRLLKIEELNFMVSILLRTGGLRTQRTEETIG